MSENAAAREALDVAVAEVRGLESMLRGQGRTAEANGAHLAADLLAGLTPEGVVAEVSARSRCSHVFPDGSRCVRAPGGHEVHWSPLGIIPEEL